MKYGGYGAVQLAAYIIHKNNIDSYESTRNIINYTKLIKLMYLVERAFILNCLPTIANDRFVAMDKGPVLSGVLDSIKQTNFMSKDNDIWEEYIERYGIYDVRLKREIDILTFSTKHKNIMDAILEEPIKYDYSHLIEYTHKCCPEWNDIFKNNINMDININDILKYSEKTKEEKEEYLRNMELYKNI